MNKFVGKGRIVRKAAMNRVKNKALSFTVAPEVGWAANVYARSVIGEAGGWTRIWFTDLVPPARPSGLSAEPLDSNAVLVTWNANGEDYILGYLLYYDTTLTPPVGRD